MAFKIGALWVREARDINDNTFKYFSGILQTLERDIPIVIFKNNDRTNDKQPDYLIFRSDPRKENKPTNGTPSDELSDDIPF